MNIKTFKCLECKQKFPYKTSLQKRCILCSDKYKKKKIIENCKNNYKEKYKTHCKNCDVSFLIAGKEKKYFCTPKCSEEYRIKYSNENWIARSSERKPKRDLRQIMYSDFRTKKVFDIHGLRVFRG
jgi:hypothetical protein